MSNETPPETARAPPVDSPQQDTVYLAVGTIQTCILPLMALTVKEFSHAIWAGQGTSYPPCEDKEYDMAAVPEAKEDAQGQGLAPAAAGPIRHLAHKNRPSKTITTVSRVNHETLWLFRDTQTNAGQS